MKSTPLKILFVASEMTPLAKTGGLADVVGALARELLQRGHDIRVVLPFYRAIRENLRGYGSAISSMLVPMGGEELGCSVAVVQGPGGVPVYLIEHHQMFDREGFYHDKEVRDYPDNARRFGFLCRAALRLCEELDFQPDIIHAHDWQAGLLPHAILQDSNGSGRPATILTIHNLAYQGVYPLTEGGVIGISPEALTPEGFEWYGGINLLKGGLLYADLLNTVSPGFATEIRQPGNGFGMEGILEQRADDLYGILNGIDDEEWNPETDIHLPAHYNVKDLTGKAVCKRALQQTLHLREEEDTPIFGLVGRFTQQKGFHLALEALTHLLASGKELQVAILGSGDPILADAFTALSYRFPGSVGLHVGYSEPIAHLIEAGSDFFVMPSIFEPCGLNQMYSLRYGTLPIVRATGGLNDTVQHVDEETGKGTGFKFVEPHTDALEAVLRQALRLYHDNPRLITKMRKAAMRKDFGWAKSVNEYEKLYKKALKKAKR